MKSFIKSVWPVAMLIVLVAGTIQSVNIAYHRSKELEVIEIPDPDYVKINSCIIFPSKCSGFSVEKYVIATNNLVPEFQYYVRAYPGDQWIKCESREEAEEIMIMLAEKAGI